MNLRVLDIAESEVIEAVQWYEQKCSGLGKDFLDSYERILVSIEEEPRRYPKLETFESADREIRRCVFNRFPYYIVFELLIDKCVVLAVAHASRRPNYWQDRSP